MTKRREDWQEEAGRMLRKLMQDHSITPDELASRLTLLGVGVTGQAVRNKVGRGSFSAAFLLAAIASMRTARVTLRARELVGRGLEEEVDEENNAKAKVATKERAVTDEEVQQVARMRKEGFRPGTPEKVRRKMEKYMTDVERRTKR